MSTGEPVSLEDYATERLRRRIAERYSQVRMAMRDLALVSCPVCGQDLLFHDIDACDAKLAEWKPTGLLNSPGLRVVSGDEV